MVWELTQQVGWCTRTKGGSSISQQAVVHCLKFSAGSFGYTPQTRCYYGQPVIYQSHSPPGLACSKDSLSDCCKTHPLNTECD